MTDTDNLDQETEEERKTGRRSKLTPELQERLCKYLSDGQYLTTACDLVGVHEATVYRWLEQAEADDPPAEFREFREAFTRARAEAEALSVESIMTMIRGGYEVKNTRRVARDGSEEFEVTLAPPDAKAAFEYLARTRPGRWRPIKAVEVSGPEGGAVQVTHGVDLSALAEKVSQARREHEAGQQAGAGA
uniref:terminase small subunit-like protein n=1 Tax=Streptosporangium sp. CA-235898 TaxID=3240073 RepID=UPI003F49079E